VVAALVRRRRRERQVRAVVRRIRAGALALPADAPVRIVAEHRSLDGAPLDVASAAVEIINLTRPIVAIAHFVALAAVALDRHPEWRARLAGDDGWLEPFAEEVRRLYPFFPLIGGRARTAFEWQGETVAAGTWMLLDLYGTNHDPATFAEPFTFSPERRLSWRDQSFDFVPQGGGRAEETHRCPGERFTVETMALVLGFLLRETGCRLRGPERVPLDRFPALRTGDVRLTVPSAPPRGTDG
jgi:fatty-acid peroxygenase